MSRVAVVLPCKNEEAAISTVIPGLVSALKSAGHIGTIVVVNDHSSDNTLGVSLEVAKSVDPQSGIEVLVLDSAAWPGKTSAQALALTALPDDFDFVAFMDSDGQHRADDLVALIAKAHTNAEIVFGIRDTAYKRSAISSIGVRFLDVAKNALGLPAKSNLSEFVVLPSKFSNQLRHHPNLGVIPIATAIVSIGQSFGTLRVTVDDRLGVQKTNFNFKALFRKAIYEVLSEPWVYLPRVFASVCVLSVLATSYGLVIGTTQVLSQHQNGVASIIILLVVFGSLNSLLLLLLLGLVTLQMQSQRRLAERPVSHRGEE